MGCGIRLLMLEATGNNIIMQVIGIKWLGSKIQ
jgi:hypothetical protein